MFVKADNTKTHLNNPDSKNQSLRPEELILLQVLYDDGGQIWINKPEALQVLWVYGEYTIQASTKSCNLQR